MTNEEIYYNSFPLLLHKITPNLRYVFLDISRESKKITVIGYYADNISDIETELLEDISDSIAGMIEDDFLVAPSYIISKKAPPMDVHSPYLLYARYENF